MMRKSISRIAFLVISIITTTSCAQSQEDKNRTRFSWFIIDGEYYAAAKLAVDAKLFGGDELRAQVKDLCRRSSDAEVKKKENKDESIESSSAARYTWYWKDLSDLSLKVGNREDACSYARAGFDRAVQYQENLKADRFFHRNLLCQNVQTIPGEQLKQHDDMVYGQWHHMLTGIPRKDWDSEFLKAHPYDRGYVQKLCDDDIAILDFNTAREIAISGNLGKAALFKVDRAEYLHHFEEALSKGMYQVAHDLIRDRARFLNASDVLTAVQAEYKSALKGENAHHAYALARSFALPAPLVRSAEKQMVAESIKRGDFSIGRMLPDGTIMIIETKPRSTEVAENYLKYRQGW